MFNKCISAILILAFLSITLTGCNGNKTDNTKQKADSTKSNDSIAAYKSISNSDDVNLKNIDISQNGSKMTAVMTFVNGCSRMGIKEENIDNVPEYSISLLHSPERIIIHLKGLHHYDYEINPSWVKFPLFNGIFRVQSADKESSDIYLQLKDSFKYSVHKNKNKLTIDINQTKKDNSDGYYVTMNAYNEYQSSDFPVKTEMNPVLCDDFVNVTLISKKYNNKNDADEFKDKLISLVGDKYNGKIIQEISLKNGSLPSYSEKENSVSSQKTVIKKNGKEYCSPVLISNGRFLEWAPDNKSYIYTKSLLNGSQSSGNIPLNNEELWYCDETGHKSKLVQYQFSSIYQSKFSPDGSKLIFSEQVDESNVLYLYDFKQRHLYNLAEEGFGTKTGGFTWSDDSKVIYAVTGESTLSLMSCDIDKPVGSRVKVLNNNLNFNGDIVYANGYLYLSNENAGNCGKIYKVSKDGSSYTILTNGSSIRISPDHKFMAVVEITSQNNDDMKTNLKIREISTGKETKISSDKLVMVYNWSSDSNTLYYTVDNRQNDNDKFTTGLYSYEVQSKNTNYIGDIVSSQIVPSNVPDRIFIMDIVTEKNSDIPVTYIVNLDRLKN